MISLPSPIWIEELKLSYEHNPKINSIINALQYGEVVLGGYSLQKGLLLKKGKMVLIPALSFQRKVLYHHIHASHEAEHVDYHKTLKRAKLNLCLPKMRKDIKKAMRECLIFQVSKGANSLPTGQLQPLPIPHLPWQDITIDFV